MAKVVVTLRIMPDSPDVDMGSIEKYAKEQINSFSDSSEFRTSIEPIAFGLKALNIIFVMDENKGSTENLERNIKNIKGVNSVEIIDARRAIG